MKLKKKSLVYFVILLLLITAFLYGFYGKVIIHPNAFIFGNQGDGMKNYYTYAYYIQNNQSYTNFEGMNYPYGENFTYTDCHPLLAFVLKLIHEAFPGIAQYSIGLLNLLMIFSIAITVILLYLLLRELKVVHLLSVLGAVAITALSPQIFRLSGHYALSYSFFIPLTIYLLILFEKANHRSRIFFLLCFSIFFFFSIHAYMGMIAATLVFTYALVGLSDKLLRRQKPWMGKHFWLMTAALIPVALYYLVVKITDIHTGRTSNPWGILENHAELSSVFIPVCSPLDKIKETLFPGLIQPWEGWSYIGMITILALIAFIVASVVSSVTSRKLAFNRNWVESYPIRLLFATSLIILAFALFVPFRWFGWERLINYFDIIKQFRAIGRFAWVFYFVSAIVLIVITNSLFDGLSKKKLKVPAYFLAVLIPVLLFAESWKYHEITSAEIVKSPNFFCAQQLPQPLKHDIENTNVFGYQAILPFPFFYIGSENFGKVADEKVYRLAFLFSYHTGLPMISSYLTRTSIHESKKIMQLLAANYYQKDIKNDLPSQKPFLLVCLNGYLNSKEAEYVKKATLICTRDDYSLYEIRPEVFFENIAEEEFRNFDVIKDSLFEKRGFLVSDTSLLFAYDDFANEATDITFSGGRGCHFGPQKDYHILLKIEKGRLPLHKKFTARLWMYNQGDNFGQDCLSGMFFFQKNKDGQVEWLQPMTSAGNSHEINGNWSLVELSLDHQDADAAYELVYKGSDLAEKTMYVDDLLFYDSDLIIYRMTNDNGKACLFKNNHRICLTEKAR